MFTSKEGLQFSEIRDADQKDLCLFSQRVSQYCYKYLRSKLTLNVWNNGSSLTRFRGWFKLSLITLLACVLRATVQSRPNTILPIFYRDQAIVFAFWLFSQVKLYSFRPSIWCCLQQYLTLPFLRPPQPSSPPPLLHCSHHLSVFLFYPLDVVKKQGERARQAQDSSFLLL